jgi:murein DD-endopeptidase MepM/ murein hydrolase activator NlpD
MQVYLVKKHDTLWKIAREHGRTTEELADLNKLKGRQIHQLRINQKLLIPDEYVSDPDIKLNIFFRGLDFKPITPKKVKVAHDGSEKAHEIAQGESLTLFIKDHAKGLKIWIEDINKKLVSVFEREVLPLGNWNLNIDSRKVKTDGALQSKKGPSTASTAEVKEKTTHNAQTTKGTTAIEESRVESGKPVQAIATIYIAKNLRLLQGNEQYRAPLIAAAERHGLSPQALSALLDAEAAKVAGVWQERSNEDDPDLAQGLAQFFEAAWMDVSKDSGSLLYVDCQKLGKADLLKKRLVAKYAIDGAATYAVINLNNFAKRTKYQVDQLPAEDKAKLAYFLHHEGVTGALRLLGIGTPYDDESAKARLQKQLGVKNVKKLKELAQQYDNDYVEAYKGWLFNYIDAKINVNNFVVSDQAALAKEPRRMSDILAALSSKPVAQPPTPKKEVPTPQPSKPPTKPAEQPEKTAPTSGNGGWHDPLAVCTLRTAKLANKTGAEFGWVRNGGKKAHQGIDLIAVPGTPIYAVADGVVYSTKAPTPAYAYGNTLVLEVALKDLPPAQADYFRKVNPGNDTIGFFYAHLSELPAKSPMIVHAGQVIGKSGESGNAKGMSTEPKGAHLHFEARQKAKMVCAGLTNRVDPLPFIQNCTNR